MLPTYVPTAEDAGDVEDTTVTDDKPAAGESSPLDLHQA